MLTPGELAALETMERLMVVHRGAFARSSTDTEEYEREVDAFCATAKACPIVPAIAETPRFDPRVRCPDELAQAETRRLAEGLCERIAAARGPLRALCTLWSDRTPHALALRDLDLNLQPMTFRGFLGPPVLPEDILPTLGRIFGAFAGECLRDANTCVHPGSWQWSERGGGWRIKVHVGHRDHGKFVLWDCFTALEQRLRTWEAPELPPLAYEPQEPA